MNVEAGVTLSRTEQEAELRARELIAETALFDELGLHRLARKARAVARDIVDLAAALEAERSSRVAIQESRDRCVAIIGKGAYYGCIAQAARAERAAAIAKQELALRNTETQRAR